jgi:hypothetical protein
MAILGGASTIKSTGLAASRAASKRARPPRRHVNPARTSTSRSQSSYRPQGYASQPAYRPRRSGTISRQPTQRKSRPILPIPSADSIADLFNSIAGFKREYGQLGVNATAQKSQLGASRGLYLKQLADAFAQQRTAALEDFATRGLSDSGLQNEALAKLQNVYTGQQAEYETGYRGQLADIMRTLQGRRADILAQRAAAERRYNQLHAQRAAALRASGYGV